VAKQISKRVRVDIFYQPFVSLHLKHKPSVPKNTTCQIVEQYSFVATEITRAVYSSNPNVGVPWHCEHLPPNIVVLGYELMRISAIGLNGTLYVVRISFYLNG
jgi:hypothetical protein